MNLNATPNQANSISIKVETRESSRGDSIAIQVAAFSILGQFQT